MSSLPSEDNDVGGGEMRIEIQEFAEEMERIMQNHDSKKGDSWKHMHIRELEELLEKEYHEWQHELFPDSKECVDLANLAMMLWWRSKKKGEVKQG